MTVHFALFLSPGGIALAHRQDAGHWAMVAETSLDVPDLAAALQNIRLEGERRGDAGFETLLVLPDDQILYTTLPFNGGDREGQKAYIARGLDGLTPYAIDELAFDWRDMGDGRFAVAVVAKETLDEAESFARDHGFNGTGFAASPPAERFPGVPLFALTQTQADLALPGIGLQFGPDEWVASPVAEKTAPETEQAAPPEAPAPETDDQPEATAPPEGTDSPTDTPPAAEEPVLSFRARRGKVDLPEGQSGSLVTNRASRLGFTAEVDTPAAPAAPAAPTTPPAPSSAAPKLSAERSVATPQAAPDKALERPALSADVFRRVTGVTDADTPTADDAPASKRGIGTALAGVSGVLARRRARPETPPQLARAAVTEPAAAPVTPDPAPSAAPSPSKPDALSRKSVFAGSAKPKGPSLRLGLMLTVVLLLGLALLALWSILFMPESSIARLFGLNEPDITIASDESVNESLIEEDVLASIEAPETILPDIDADLDTDLDLAELADAEPEISIPTLEETEQFYAVNGIWQRAPEALPAPSATDAVEDIYTASIDRVIPVFDAFALATPAALPDGEVPQRFASPPPFGTTFAVNPDGLVAPSADGALTADGVRVVLGTPPILPIPRDREDAPEETELASAETDILGTFRPTERPDDLQETRERQVLGGFSRTELAGFRPTTRPPSVQDVALAARAAEERQAEALAAAESASAAVTEGREALIDLDGSNGALIQLAGASDLAISRSNVPRLRPADIEDLVARAQRANEGSSGATITTASAPAPQSSSAPSIPSNASVSRAATMNNAISLRNINLIGVSGSESSRRALVRLASGRFVTVTIGDRLDGGRVAAIGAGSLQYVKNGRNITLDVPQG